MAMTMLDKDQQDYIILGRTLRRLILDIVRMSDGPAHFPSSFSIVDILGVLYSSVLRSSDHFLLSKGHGALALYAVLSHFGKIQKDDLASFCQFHSRFGSHPSWHKIPGVEMGAGSLGHGPSLGIGMALASRIKKEDSRVFVLVGDGECNEGSIWEAAMSASKHKLGNFSILVDYNRMQSYDRVDQVLPLEPFRAKWESFGFEVHEADMKNHPLQLQTALSAPMSDRPKVVICHTVKGMGAASLENNLEWHHRTKVSKEELDKILWEIDHAQ